jgi:hypothetical protein
VTQRKIGFDLKLPLAFLRWVNYRGVVGNQISLGIVALIVLAVIAICLWGRIEAAYLLVPAVILVLAIILFSVHKTLKENPGSVLEDALYLEHRKMDMELAAKNRPSIQLTPLIEDPQPPLAIEGTVAVDEGGE